MDPIVIKTVNRAEDTYAFFRIAGEKRYKTGLISNCILLAAFVAVGLYSLRVEKLIDRFAICGIIVSLWSIINVLCIPSRQKKGAEARREREGDTELSFAFYDDHMTDDYKKKDEFGHIDLDYSGLYRAVETPKHLFIFPDSGKAFIIRLEDIPQDVLPQLRDTIRSAMPFSAYEIKNK